MYTLNEPRPRRPYKKKTASKAGALIFGLGLGAIVATVAILIWVGIPNFSSRLENLPYYARTYYRKLIPHPEYLPTPAPAAVVASSVNVSDAGEVSSSRLESPSEATASDTGEAASVLSDPQEEPVSSESEAAAPSRPDLPEAAAGEAIPAASGIAGESLRPEDNLLLRDELATEISLAPVRYAVQLTGLTHQWQTWNNCGPATITMNMSYFGHAETQVDAAEFLKPNRDDKNVSPHELAAYARTVGNEAIVRQGGSLELLKELLSNDFPVLLETWLVHDGDGLGHYRLLTGYDEATGQFNTFDSLNGPDVIVDQAQLDTDWRVFNRLYIVVFPPEQAAVVAAIIGDDVDDTVLYERLVAEARAEIAQNPNDAIATFNLGDALTRLKRYGQAVAAFDQARQIGLHWRRLWYQFTPFEAYYAVERYQDVLDLSAATLNGAGGLEEAYYYHGLALQATDQPGAADDFEAAIAYNPHFTPAIDALSALSN
jgi:hypothetical protein